MRKRGQPKSLKKFKLTPALTYAGGRVREAPPELPLIERFTSDSHRFAATGYMCATDWSFELGQNCHGIEVYRSADDLKVERDCWKECGIVEVEVTIKKTIAPSKI